jgi:mannose-6-phosphate isomerase-like protein (cupin superfamily)
VSTAPGRATGLLLVASALASACAATPGDGGPPATLDAAFPAGRATLPLDALAEQLALAPGEALAVQEVGRDAHTSHHLVTIRDCEEPHRHERHDLIVVVLRGRGEMRLGADTRAVGEGSILYVPRGAVHAFCNRADGPAVAYAIYAPPFDGRDRVAIE